MPRPIKLILTVYEILVEPPKKKSRLELLKEWQLQKKKKEIEKSKAKKPIFHTGGIQRTITGSPKLANITNLPESAVKSKGVKTRAQTKAQLTRLVFFLVSVELVVVVEG